MAAILDVYKGTNGNQYSDWDTSSYGDVMGQLFYYLSVDSTTCSIYIGALSVLAKKSSSYSEATNGHWRWRTYHSNPGTSYPSSSTLYTDSTNRSISTSEVRLDNGTANTYTPAFTINANALTWDDNYTEGTFTISGRVVKPSGTSSADSDSRQATPSQTIKLHLSQVSWPQADVTKTLNYSSSDQFVTTIAEPSGGSGSFTYELTGATDYLYLSGRNIYAKGGTKYLTGYSKKKVSVIVKDQYTGQNLAADMGVWVTVTMSPAAVTLKYNHNGGSFSSTATRPSRYNTSAATIESRQANGTAYDKWIDTIPITTTHWNLYNLDNTYWGVIRTGYHIDETQAWCTNASGTGNKFHQDDTDSNTTNCVTTKRLNGGTEITNNKTITLYANWQPNTYTVTFDKQNGSGGSNSVTATYNSAMPSISVPTRPGYSFQGYYDGTNGTGTPYYTPTGTSANRYDKTSATTLYAYWFDGDSPNNIVNGGYNSLQTTQTLTLSTSDISENIKYYWGTSSTGTPNTTYSGEITKTISSAGTYYFITKDDTGNSTTTPVYIYSYKIQNILEKTTGTTGTYNNSNYETQGNANTYIIRSTTKAPSLFYNAPSNSIFKGWSTSFSSSTSSLSTSNISINSDNVTYYMWFNRNKYTVKYNANGGTGTMSNSTFKVGSNETLRLNSFTPQIGYTFGGWASSVANATAGTVLRTNGAPHNNLTTTDGATFNLYAIWKFRGNYIYTNDTDGWVKVVPFIYDGSTWRETQPFVYTSNGWKSLIN